MTNGTSDRTDQIELDTIIKGLDRTERMVVECLILAMTQEDGEAAQIVTDELNALNERNLPKPERLEAAWQIVMRDVERREARAA